MTAKTAVMASKPAPSRGSKRIRRATVGPSPCKAASWEKTRVIQVPTPLASAPVMLTSPSSAARSA